MDFPAVNDLSDFWFDLFPPIFLGALSIIGFLWVLGKENRQRIMKALIEDKSIDPAAAVASIGRQFTRRIIKYFELDSLKPLVALSLIFLFFYGLDQLLLYTFQPLLTLSPNGIFFAAGVDEELIARLWMHYQSPTLTDLYLAILKATEDTLSQPVVFLDSVQVFVRFDLLCCLILFILPIFKVQKLHWDKKVFLRLFLFSCVLVTLLVGILFTEIHEKNDEIRQMCYRAESMIDTGTSANVDPDDDELLQDYLARVRMDKQASEHFLFYGGYGIRNRYADAWDSIVGFYQEFCRFVTHRISHPCPYDDY